MHRIVFAAEVIRTGVLIALIVICALCFKLDLGLRAPNWRRAWPWIAALLSWDGLVFAVETFHPTEIDERMLEWMKQYTALQLVILVVLLGPLLEELFCRGALFSSLVHTWGVKVAVIGPSVLWAILHTTYDAWAMFSIAVAGVLLALIRWKSGSVYLPWAAHAAWNLVVLVSGSFRP
jgi:membrane protease YdiL (CAAX protease family)